MEVVTCHSQSLPPLSPILVDELIIEILSWLPVKSLLQCRCVSKSWEYLISKNPNFVKLHLSRSPKNGSLILTFRNFIHYDVVDDDEDEEYDVRAITCSKKLLFENPSLIFALEEDRCFRMNDYCWFIGSCNGLACFFSEDFINDELSELRFYFWDPALRLTSQLSAPLCVNKMPVNSYVSRLGYGYDRYSNTYKVIAIILTTSENTIVKVHSMGGNCWRQILSLPALHIIGESDAQFLNGTLNWLVQSTPGFHYNGSTFDVNQLSIFSLHLEKETYQQFSLPSGFDEVLSVEPDLRVLGDCLCFCHYYKGTHYVIWKMKEFGVRESWSQLFKISDQHLLIDDVHPLLPLCTSENYDVVVMAKRNDCEIILYNRKTNRVEHIQNNFEEWTEANGYVESLVLPY